MGIMDRIPSRTFLFLDRFRLMVLKYRWNTADVHPVHHYACLYGVWDVVQFYEWILSIIIIQFYERIASLWKKSARFLWKLHCHKHSKSDTIRSHSTNVTRLQEPLTHQHQVHLHHTVTKLKYCLKNLFFSHVSSSPNQLPQESFENQPN